MVTKQRNVRIIAMALLIVSLITLSIAFAMLSRKLNIKGEAKIDPIKWGIYFASDREDGTLVATPAENVNKQPKINSDEPTKIEDLDITLYKPGDRVSFTVNLVNESDINVAISKVTKPLELDNVSENVKKVIHYNVNYTNVNAKKEVEIGDVISANTTINLTVTIYYSREDITNEILASDEFKNGLTLNLSGYKLDFEQTDLAANVTTKAPPDMSWKYKVNDEGLITAYNYAHGTNVVVPAEVDGIPVKTINQQSFMQTGNVTLHHPPLDGNAYFVIEEEEEDNYNIVKNKLITMFMSDCDEGDTECSNAMKQITYFCKNNNSCYNLAAEEAGVIAKETIPDGLEIVSLAVSTDPNLSTEESITELGANITTLDLSKATNLTTIEDEAFRESGITSVNFGENSKVKILGYAVFRENQISSLKLPNSITEVGEYTFYGNQITDLKLPSNLVSIGNDAFSSNQISSLTIPKSITSIGNQAFYSNPLTSILIKRTKEDFTANVTADSWYDPSNNPTITYEP